MLASCPNASIAPSKCGGGKIHSDPDLAKAVIEHDNYIKRMLAVVGIMAYFVLQSSISSGIFFSLYSECMQNVLYYLYMSPLVYLR